MKRKSVLLVFAIIGCVAILVIRSKNGDPSELSYDEAFLKADTDLDGYIDRIEYVANYKKAAELGEGRVSRVEPSSLFAMGDEDADRFLDFDEWQRLAMGGKKDVFASADKDNDGRLTCEEYLEMRVLRGQSSADSSDKPFDELKTLEFYGAQYVVLDESADGLLTYFEFLEKREFLYEYLGIDADKDGFLSKSEYMQRKDDERLSLFGGRMRDVGARFDRFFAVVDKNGNDEVSFDEWAFDDWKIELFAYADMSEDGMVDEEEFLRVEQARKDFIVEFRRSQAEERFLRFDIDEDGFLSSGEHATLEVGGVGTFEKIPDANNNGYLDWSEYFSFKLSNLEAAKERNVKARLDGIDGARSVREDAFDGYSFPEKFVKRKTKDLRKKFIANDANADGRLSPSESMALDRSNKEVLFRSLDFNEDFLVSSAEYLGGDEQSRELVVDKEIGLRLRFGELDENRDQKLDLVEFEQYLEGRETRWRW